MSEGERACLGIASPVSPSSRRRRSEGSRGRLRLRPARPVVRPLEGAARRAAARAPHRAAADGRRRHALRGASGARPGAAPGGGAAARRHAGGRLVRRQRDQHPRPGADRPGRSSSRSRSNVLSGLTHINGAFVAQPDLAADWTVSDDGTEYTFNLREGVTFHNGDPFTADDVVFTFQRSKDPAQSIHTQVLVNVAGRREGRRPDRALQARPAAGVVPGQDHRAGERPRADDRQPPRARRSSARRSTA